MKKTKAEHIFWSVMLISAAAVAIEKFYKHPTFGTGLQALMASAQAAIAIA